MDLWDEKVVLNEEFDFFEVAITKQSIGFLDS